MNRQVQDFLSSRPVQNPSPSQMTDAELTWALLVQSGKDALNRYIATGMPPVTTPYTVALLTEIRERLGATK